MFFQQLQKIYQSFKENQSTFAKTFIKASSGSLGIKVASLGLTFISSLVLARFLGTENFGLYTYALAWATLLSIPATLGLDKLLIREVSVYQARSDWGLMRGILSWANSSVLLISTALSLLAAAIAWWLKIDTDPSLVWAIWIALLALPIHSLTNLRMGAMQGLHKIVLAMLPEILSYPILIVAILGTWQFLEGKEQAIFWVLGIRIVALAICFLLGAKWLYDSIPTQVGQTTSEYQVKKWLQSSLPFMFLGVTEIINTQSAILMLGAIKGPEVVGIYAVVSRMSMLVIFIQGAVNRVLGPIVASFYVNNQTTKLQQVIAKSSRLVLLISLIIFSILVIFGSKILLLFGSDFDRGYTALVILIVGQLINSALGPVGLLLNMTGHEKLTAISVGSTALLNLVLNSFLIPKWGMNGAATATATSIVIINFVNIILVKKKLNMYSTPWKIF
jgi:O-antigen/teichoic acid export membrane protein